MKRRMMAILLVTAALLALASCSTMNSRGISPINDKQWNRFKIRLDRELDLTSEQEDDLDRIIDSIQKRVNDYSEPMKRDSADAAELILSENLTVEELLSFREGRIGEREELQRYIMKEIVSFHSSLTQEQREKLLALWQERN